jgi:hypothetical protein
MNEEFPVYAGPLAFFKRHYNGDYSLARSYWVNNTLVSWFAPLLGLLLLPWLVENFAARYASMGVLLITTLGVLAWFWAVSGTWASASKHVKRGGAGFWANAAKVMIVLGCVKTFGDMAKMTPVLMEHIQVASGHQLGPTVTLEVLADGKSIRLSGGINDGAAAVLVGNLASASRLGARPLATVRGSMAFGIDPKIMGLGPVEAIKRLLVRLNIELKDMDVIEINEAFAAQVLGCAKLLNLSFDDTRINPNGGAIALGHPLGASGARLVLTASRHLQETNGKYALVSLCVGMGQGLAMVLERFQD